MKSEKQMKLKIKVVIVRQLTHIPMFVLYALTVTVAVRAKLSARAVTSGGVF